jgi:hypothetical protein
MEYWNNHKICSQLKKANMSGHMLYHAFTVPEVLGVLDSWIEVDLEVVHALCAQIPVSQKECM